MVIGEKPAASSAKYAWRDYLVAVVVVIVVVVVVFSLDGTGIN